MLEDVSLPVINVPKQPITGANNGYKLPVAVASAVGHAVAQYTGNQLGIVPILFVELLGQTLDGDFVSALVLELEVVTLVSVLIHILDDVARHHILRQDDAFIIIQHTGEYFVGMIVQQADECHPFLLVVLEADNVCIQYSGTCFNDRRRAPNTSANCAQSATSFRLYITHTAAFASIPSSSGSPMNSRSGYSSQDVPVVSVWWRSMSLRTGSTCLRGIRS